MRIYKKCLKCLLILLIMIIASNSCFLEVNDQQYTQKEYLYIDVSESDWFAKSVKKACELGLIKRTGQTVFEPQAGMTRAMLVYALYMINKHPSIIKDIRLPFEDVTPEDTYYDAVCWLYLYHMKPDNTEKYFYPLSVVTREQAVRVLYAFSGEPPLENKDLSRFADNGLIHPQAKKAYEWAVYNELIKGQSENGKLYLKPHNDLNRAEAASLLIAFYRYNLQHGITRNVTLPEEKRIRKYDIPAGVKVPILMYHEISDTVRGSLDYLFVTPGSMRSQLQWLKDNNYETIHFSDLTRLSEFRKPIILTFDDGYEGNYTNLFPLLKEFNMKATIFVITDEIGSPHRMTADQIREISDSGLVSIQSHTKSHKKLNTLSDLQLAEECLRSKKEIRRITGLSPFVISYPEGWYSLQVISTVSSYYDFGIIDRLGPWKTNQQSYYSIPRTVIPRSFTLRQFAAAVIR